MWILHFLPETLILSICNVVLFAGIFLTVAAFFIKSIPVINQYRLPFQVLGIALLVAGVYWRGGYAIEMEWRERVAEMEQKVSEAAAASLEANKNIKTKIVIRTQVVRTRGEDIVKYVDREVVPFNNKFAPGGPCEIPKEFFKAINTASESPK
jgi:hypothetical protein